MGVEVAVYMQAAAVHPDAYYVLAASFASTSPVDTGWIRPPFSQQSDFPTQYFAVVAMCARAARIIAPPLKQASSLAGVRTGGIRPRPTAPPPHPPRHLPVRHATTDLHRRRAVTVLNDTGQVPWKSLTRGEKAARATQQSFNIGLVVVGLLATGGVATVLWLEVFSRDSKTAVFNAAADRVRNDVRCRAVLAGDALRSPRDIQAYGEPSWSRWARNRTISSRIEKDGAGVEHLRMRFYVEGPAAKGTVHVYMTRRPDGKGFEYRTLALDVAGRPRYYVLNADVTSTPKKVGKMFGVKWN